MSPGLNEAFPPGWSVSAIAGWVTFAAIWFVMLWGLGDLSLRHLRGRRHKACPPTPGAARRH